MPMEEETPSPTPQPLPWRDKCKRHMEAKRTQSIIRDGTDEGEGRPSGGWGMDDPPAPLVKVGLDRE